ncbi:Rha family transcriptional regulator [Anoxybacillus flavithermus]|uniref:Rha family transcriptional regulator n=1 Tax=Anoxybacillus flavithermus TaxID=33934 RepID=A0A2G5RS60_9BACL|nr:MULTISPECIES: phage antirepressor KilAC domain-containing protein [Anoxybacillus]KFZ41922.1 Rha family transcriptional regulator [Anoxybacillus sp. KU2-6(11)]PIC05522.1 Rha family transcriptional regulator [Anoxybacillus flavithermus]
MNQLVFIESNRVVTDSLTVAEVFGKRHDHVLRDIEVQIEKLKEAGEHEFSLLNFGESTYTNERGREYKRFLLTEEAFTLVAMSYTTPEAMKMKVRFIEEFKRMRAELEKQKQPFKLPTTYKEALLQLVEQVERNEQLQLQNAQKDQIIKELQPKATYYDLILQNKSLISISKIAKDYGMSAMKMNQLLHQLGIQYKQGDCWLLYSKYQDKGYTQSKTHTIDSETSKMHTYWTQKGRLFIYEMLKNKLGILPLIERDEQTA